MNMWWKSFATVLLVTCLYDKVFGADQVFQCPDSFIDGEVNSLTVQVNKTAMEKAQCEVPPRLFNFIRKRTSDDPEASSTILCRIQYSCSNPGPVSEPSNKENVQCGCVQKSQDNILTFEMKFYPNETLDTGARFSYTLCVSPIHPPTKVESDSCSSASFAFHSGWNQTVGVRHPSLWTFLRHQKDSQAKLELQADAADRGDPRPPRKRKWRQLE
ncbi:uncharacterized protein LOC143301466 isoform X5 [Babylonia areolata]|uniref:uncharacterized protein LOC143301466 isoform X5 n=1 Tax=Babylonia areolata TaxID=304850 RepID=UPI003FD3EB15